ncbi:MAG TPA: hypothetical protein VHX13_11560 [Acidobacteriaceae bacterium]|jgi:photosystem II stability/assembly factor-like uncharacterized protein|nr:hypothetical protein [Acidobacteriaceae bacterium]
MGALAAMLGGMVAAGIAQESDTDQNPSTTQEKGPAAGFKALQLRQIGPFRGGRVDAVEGVPGEPLVYYFGGTGGGVFKTTDGGHTWKPITDGQINFGSIGSIAVAASDHNVIYVGTGESAIRGNASHGDGVYKSMDAGQTWKHVGLEDTQQIGQIRVDPRDPNLVYVAAMGHMAGPNAERGVFRSKDGGKTWQKVLFKSDKAGAVDLAMDPSNPRVLYAAFWQVVRKPWTFESGGPDSGIWKTTDGGDTWTELTHNPGLPKGALGRIGLTVSAVDPERVWALIEAQEGGIYRSDDAGKTWAKLNGQNEIKQRAWYYSQVFADPKNENTVYAVNTELFRSTDGGKTFTTIRNNHGDNHDMWIAPEDPNRFIESDDGGAQISFDGGKSWSTEGNEPTGQFYRVTLDNDFPYHIYGAQQDNTTVEIVSRSNNGAITDSDWHDVGGGESGWIAPDPLNSNYVYAGSYDGLLTRYDNKTGSLRNINPWPDNPMGSGVEAMKYRMQWSFPLVFSPNNPHRLYAGAQVLLASDDEGQSWKAMSPDLTRNDKTKQGPSGGPITKDNTAVEYYDTIFTIDESPVKAGVIWVGSDDGLIHVTQDDGNSWQSVTPKDMPKWIRINCIAASPFEPGTAYVAATMYLSDDFHPFLYRTNDYGKTWKKIVNGIPDDDFTRTIRPDPNRKGLVFAGTESHLYISYDDGDSWLPFQLNLPAVPVTDIAFQKQQDDMVLATQGRGFYVMDDMALVRALDPARFNRSTPVELFPVKKTVRIDGGGFGFGRDPSAGQNPPNGAVIYYYLKDKPQGEVKLRFLTADGKVVREISSKPKKGQEAEPENPYRPGGGLAPAKEGLNKFVWDLRYSDATGFPGLLMWDGSLRGPMATPGEYKVELTVDGKTDSQNFTVVKDPRAPTTAEDFQKQLDLALKIRDRVTEANQSVVAIRAAEDQLKPYLTNSNAKVKTQAKQLTDELTGIEEAIYQTKLHADEDALNYPIRLNNKLASVEGVVEDTDVAPTAQSYQVFDELSAQLQTQLDHLHKVETTGVEQFNKLVRDQNIPAVSLQQPKAD